MKLIFLLFNRAPEILRSSVGISSFTESAVQKADVYRLMNIKHNQFGNINNTFREKKIVLWDYFANANDEITTFNINLIVFSFAIILYELNSRRGPFGKLGLSLKQVLRKVVRFGFVHEPIFRPPLDQLRNSFDFVRNCLEEAWSESPGMFNL
jgi:hypothetical protein